MDNIIVDEIRAKKKWAPVLESLKIKDSVDQEDRLSWMATYAEMHSLSMNENVAYSTLGNLKGMGAVTAPIVSTTPGYVAGSTAGSGDIAQNLLPVSMKIAAQTIGLDLVAVKPTASPRVDLLFVDFKYDNNPLDSNADEKPLVFKVTASAGLTTLLNALLTNTSTQEVIGGINKRLFVGLTSKANIPSVATTEPTGSKEGVLEFLGFSRIDGLPMFRSYRQNNNGAAGGYTFDQTKNTFAVADVITSVLAASGISYNTGTITGATGALTGVAIQLVSSMEDNIPGFVAGWNLDSSMNRAQSEYTYPGVMGADVQTKSFQIGDIEIKAALKRTQIEDVKASTGLDLTQKMESVLINELSQKISREIVAKVKSLGTTNRSSRTVPVDGNGVSLFDFNVDNYVAVNGPAPGGETYHSIQRKVITKINEASNYILTEGRVGPAQYLITNGRMAAIFQDVVGYTINPANGKLSTNGQLYPQGTIGNISIYVDPYQAQGDLSIFLGRKNAVDQPGLLFVPYLLAQNVSLISEGTFAPVMLIRSRYAIVDCGYFPEKQFFKISITDTNGVLG